MEENIIRSFVQNYIIRREKLGISALFTTFLIFRHCRESLFYGNKKLLNFKSKNSLHPLSVTVNSFQGWKKMSPLQTMIPTKSRGTIAKLPSCVYSHFYLFNKKYPDGDIRIRCLPKVKKYDRQELSDLQATAYLGG